MKLPSLTVVMTALNEQDNIEEVIRRMHKTLSSHSGDFQIVVIDDGSTDDTYKKASGLLHLGNLQVIKNAKNLGTGKSIRSFLPNLSTDFYCWFPTDLELDPSEMSAALALMESHDIVISFLVNDQRTHSRQFLSRFFVQILNLTFGYQYPYYNGVSLIRSDLLPNPQLLSSRRFFTHAEILILSLKDTLRVETVPFKLYERHSGESKAMRLNAFWDVGFNYLKLISKKMRQ